MNPSFVSTKELLNVTQKLNCRAVVETSGALAVLSEALRAKDVFSVSVRGSQCLSDEDLLKEISAALQFPPYFGFNYSALDECLRDLYENINSTRLHVIIQDAELLETAGLGTLERVVDGLRDGQHEAVNNFKSADQEFSVLVGFSDSTALHQHREMLTRYGYSFSSA